MRANGLRVNRAGQRMPKVQGPKEEASGAKKTGQPEGHPAGEELT